MKTPINITLVEDNPAYREVIELAIKIESDMQLSGAFGAAEVALRGLQYDKQSPRPDIILLDLNLPGMTGLEAIPWFTKEAPSAKIIVLSQSEQEADVLCAISQGACGYLLKKSRAGQITESIRNVMHGNSLIDSTVARYITKVIQGNTNKIQLDKALSEREMEILHLLGDGLVKKEIAHQLNISQGTVATHVRHIYDKLQVANAPAAISKAYKAGILSPKG